MNNSTTRFKQIVQGAAKTVGAENVPLPGSFHENPNLRVFEWLFDLNVLYDKQMATRLWQQLYAVAFEDDEVDKRLRHALGIDDLSELAGQIELPFRMWLRVFADSRLLKVVSLVLEEYGGKRVNRFMRLSNFGGLIRVPLVLCGHPSVCAWYLGQVSGSELSQGVPLYLPMEGKVFASDDPALTFLFLTSCVLPKFEIEDLALASTGDLAVFLNSHGDSEGKLYTVTPAELFFGFRGKVDTETVFKFVQQVDKLVLSPARRSESAAELEVSLKDAMRLLSKDMVGKGKKLDVDSEVRRVKRNSQACAVITSGLGVGGKILIQGEDGFQFSLELICTGIEDFQRQFAFRQEFPDGTEIVTENLGNGLEPLEALRLLVSGKILKFDRGLNPELLLEFNESYGVVLSYPASDRFVVKMAVFSENEKQVASQLFTNKLKMESLLPLRKGDFDSVLKFESLWPDLRTEESLQIDPRGSQEGFKLIVDLPRAVGLMDFDPNNFSLSEALVLALSSSLGELPVVISEPLEFKVKASRVFGVETEGGFELLVSTSLPLLGEWWHAVHKTFSHSLMQLVFSRLLETYKFEGEGNGFGDEGYLHGREFILRIPLASSKTSKRLKFEDAVLEVVV